MSSSRIHPRSPAPLRLVCGLLTLSLLPIAAGLAALEVPFLGGRVNDLAGMLDAGERDRLEQALASFEEETGSQVVVLTVPSLEGDSLEDFSIRVVETWQLGREGVDDGALLLIAEAERRMRIETGYGLEGVLTDAASRRILDRVITPRFRAGDFAGGIEAGVDAMLSVIRGEELPAPERRGPPPGPVLAGCFQLFVLLLVLGLFVAQRVSSRGGRRRRSGAWAVGPLLWGAGRGWSSGRSRGGGSFGRGFSGGGGSFGGGGASGGW
ncbi:MAG TPA: TPM domain-containing protein [Thermoanaerobaculia bacterium]|nr:TPM domain-containing protein [Thermoanaerobaculia bacterium]